MELHTLPDNPGAVFRYAIRGAARLTVLTDHAKRKLQEWDFQQDIFVLPDAVDMGEFSVSASREELRRSLQLPLDKKIALYAGSFYLYDWKGVDVMMEAAKECGSDILFVLVGANPDEVRDLKKGALPENVRIVPRVSHALIPSYLKAADVLVLPNKVGDKTSELYTSPLKLFEYMASQRPIVSADLPSLREVLDEDAAVFFKPNDPHDLARAVRRVLSDDAAGLRMASVAFRKVQGYTWGKRADILIAALRKI